MPPFGPKRELAALKRFVSEVEIRYLGVYLAAPPTLAAPTRNEELDVAAFTVLAHGAFENYVEGVAVWALGKYTGNWIKRRRAGKGTAALLLTSAKAYDPSTDSNSVFDVIRLAIDSATTSHSKVIQQNNGTALQHLRSLLIPLGIDVPDDPLLSPSLAKLVKLRHEWAHQSRFGARQLITARAAADAAGDCVKIAERIHGNVVRLRL